MGERSVRQSARRAALDAQAGQRRERQERDRRIDALAVEVLVALGERDAAERPRSADRAFPSRPDLAAPVFPH